MARLRELSEGYLDAAALLRMGIEDADQTLKKTTDPRARRKAQREIHLMRLALQQVREVGTLVQHYYEPGYYRNRKYTV